jgi:ParB family protein of integrating conjugative element (PFGI_1 class)
MKEQLLKPSFDQKAPVAQRMSDPIVDTPMVLTLDETLPWDTNPRTTRNPKYDELKESIRQRGLDTPPPVTRRPGEDKFRIRNGGNTRLAILNELYRETGDDKFFRFHSLFRPWDAVRGEIISLTGHLAENDLQGQLLFIERAIGVDKARALYEEEAGETVSLRELSRRLKADGYLQLLGQSMQHQNKAIREVAEIAWNEFARDPDVGNRLPSRVDVIEERLNAQPWVKDVQAARELKATEFGVRTQQNSPQFPLSSDSELSGKSPHKPRYELSSESEPSLKPQSSHPVRNPNSYSTYTDTHKDVCKSSVHVPLAQDDIAADLLQALHRLPPDQKRNAVEAMQKVPTDLKPALIKQWAHRYESGSLRNPLGYLLTLVASAVRGEFNSNWNPDDKSASGETLPAMANPIASKGSDASKNSNQLAQKSVPTPARNPEAMAAAKQEISAMMSQLRFGKPNAQ